MFGSQIITIANFLVAFLVAAGFLAIFRVLAFKINLLDVPDSRKQHGLPAPLIGGLAIYCTIALISLVTPGLLSDYRWLLLIVGFIVLVGMADDLYSLRPTVRILAHSAGALMMSAVAGVKLTHLGDILFIGPVELGIVAIPFTVFATVGVVNASNMIDGVDCLASGLVIIALSLVAIVALIAGQHEMLRLKPILIAALMAFAAYNCGFLRQKDCPVFLGDAGSTSLGFMLAWLLISASQGDNALIAPVYALWFYAIPLIDTLMLIPLRLMFRRSPFDAGTDHLHHRLLDAGFSASQTTLMIYGLAIACGLVGLAGHLTEAPEAVMFMGFVALLLVYAGYSVKNVQSFAVQRTQP